MVLLEAARLVLTDEPIAIATSRSAATALAAGIRAGDGLMTGDRRDTHEDAPRRASEQPRIAVQEEEPFPGTQRGILIVGRVSGRTQDVVFSSDRASGKVGILRVLCACLRRRA